jgi:pimeloyl-ACP methyl ester carboxylesterase
VLKNIAFLIILSATFGAFADGFSADVVAGCSSLADTSVAENVRILIIGIEGTNEFAASDADALFSYSIARKKGPVGNPHPTLRKHGGLLTDGILFPLLHAFGDQIDAISLDFNNPFNNGFGNALTCAQQWMAVPDHKIMIIGHSTGAQQAIQLANSFNENHIPVDTLVTIDAIPLMDIFTGVTKLEAPRGVARYLNFYQTVDRDPIFHGQPATNADVNKMVSDVKGHFTVTASKIIYQDLFDRVSLSLVNGVAEGARFESE